MLVVVSLLLATTTRSPCLLVWAQVEDCQRPEGGLQPGLERLNSNPGNNLRDFSVQCLKRVIRRHAKNISGVTNLLVMTQMRTILEVE